MKKTENKAWCERFSKQKLRLCKFSARKSKG